MDARRNNSTPGVNSQAHQDDEVAGTSDNNKVERGEQQGGCSHGASRSESAETEGAGDELHDDAIRIDTSSEEEAADVVEDEEEDDEEEDPDDQLPANVTPLMWDGPGWLVGDDAPGWVFVDRRADFVATCRKGFAAAMHLVEGFVTGIESRISVTNLADAAVAADEIVSLCELLDAVEEDEKEAASRADRTQTAATSASPNNSADHSRHRQSSDGAARTRHPAEDTQVATDTDRTDAWWRRDRLTKSEPIIHGLCKLLHRGDALSQTAACSAIAGISHNHVENATKLGSTEGILDGLLVSLAGSVFSDDDEAGRTQDERVRQEAALQALVDLAMRNAYNKVAIVSFPGMLRSLTAVLSNTTHHHAQDTAAMVIANCADNFAAGGGTTAAKLIVAEPKLLDALRALLVASLESLESSSNRSACLAAVVSLSDHAAAVPLLREAEMVSTLQTILSSGKQGAAHKALRAEALMAMSNLSPNLSSLRGDEAVLRTVVKLVKYAIKGRRGQGRETIWAVRECLRPLARISVNAHNRRLLAVDPLVHKIILRVLLSARPADTSAYLTARADQEEEAALALLLLSRVMSADCPSGNLKQLLRRSDVRAALAWMASRTDRTEDLRGVGAEIDWDLALFADRHLAFCMAMHPRLGAQSAARWIDACVLQMTLQGSVSTPLAARCILSAV